MMGKARWAVIALLSCALGTLTFSPVVAADVVTVVAVGDIAQANGHQADTAALASRINPSQILLLGDLAYYQGSLEQFEEMFVPTWGTLADKTWAVPGNHEYGTARVAGYRTIVKRYGWPMQSSGYFWWDRNIAGTSWAVIALDSERTAGTVGTQQMSFLRSALRRHQGQPTIVIWHRPRFTAGLNKNFSSIDAYWKVATSDIDVKIVLWGHDHNYQRRTHRTGSGTSTHLVDTFVVGTGGAALRDCQVPSAPPALLCGSNNFGVLKLSLSSNKYVWEFVHTDDSVADRGRRSF